MVDAITYLIQPLPLGILLLLIGYLAGIFKLRFFKSIGVTGFLLITIFSMPIVGKALVANLEKQYAPLDFREIPDSSIAIVLSGGIDLPVTPRPMFELTHASDRLLHTSRLYRQGKLSHIIVTGGSTLTAKESEDEAVYGIELLTQLGVNQEFLVGEYESTSTFENIIFAEELLSQLVEDKSISAEKETILLITSAVHMPRAMAVVRRSGLPSLYTVLAAPTDFRVALSSKNPLFGLLPSSPGLNLTSIALHEYFGWMYYMLKGRI